MHTQQHINQLSSFRLE